MSPDDLRHGTYAGHSAHRRDGEKSCDQCVAARRDYDQRRQVKPRAFVIADCRACGRQMRHVAFGLCSACYKRQRKQGSPYPTVTPTPFVDEAVVERVLHGDPVPANRLERAEVCRRWVLSGRSLNDLARLTGWRPSRYYKVTEAAKRQATKEEEAA